MTVLVITEPIDVTADVVIVELNRRGVPVHRIDVADFPQTLAVAATIGGHGQWSGSLSDPTRSTALDDIDTIYYRRPNQFQFAPDLDPFERRWAEREARNGFSGILNALPAVRWLNHPHAMAAAEFKPRQLAVAASLGLTVPATLITNRPDEARSFVAAAPKAVYKPFRPAPHIDLDIGQHVALATTVVTADMVTDAVAGTACLFQHWVPKDHELRVTVVGDQVFAARIDAHSDAARIDWRTDFGSLTYTPITLPDHLAQRLVHMTATLGLVFAAYDLIVTPDGQEVFLEVNPGGQWAWIEHETGLPIAAAIADHLEAQ